MQEHNMNRHLSTWRSRILSVFRIALLISGCVAAPTSDAFAATWSTTDFKTGATLPSNNVTTLNGARVHWEVGNYLSGNLQIYGLLCTPTSPGPHPVAILNHGLPPLSSTGTETGIGFNEWTGCTEMAGNGWLTAITTYRGEVIDLSQVQNSPLPNWSATSGGFVQLCLGEVDDVLNLLLEIKAMPDANASQVLMWGHSHGSCITERAIERGAAVKIAVSLDGPTDFSKWQPTQNLGSAYWNPRSSAFAINNPSALTKVVFLRVQAEGDMNVHPDQACELASMLPGIQNWHLFSEITPPGVYFEGPKECANYPMPWMNPSNGSHAQFLPDEGHGGAWQSPTLLMYSGLDHSLIRGKAWEEFASFVNQFANGWSASIPPNFIPFET